MSKRDYENDFEEDQDDEGPEDQELEDSDNEIEEEISEGEQPEDSDDEDNPYEELTEEERRALQEEVEKEEESLLDKLQKELKREKKQMEKQQKGMKQTVKEAKKKDAIENNFRDGFDIGRRIKYRKVIKGKLEILLGTIFGYDENGVKVYFRDQEDYVLYDSVQELLEGERQAQEEIYYNEEGKKVDWKKLEGKDLAKFILYQEKRDREIREAKSNGRSIVMKTDKKYPHQIYLRGFDPKNSFVKGYDVGRDVFVSKADEKVRGKIIDYNKDFLIIALKNEKIEVPNDKVPSLVEIVFEKLQHPAISERIILESRVDEKIAGYERYDIFGDLKKIVITKWQKLLSEILRQDVQTFQRPEKDGFVDLDDEELFRSGDPFENWVVANKKNILDQLYKKLNGQPLFEVLYEEERKTTGEVAALEEYQRAKLVEVFLKTKKEFDDFYEKPENFIGGENNRQEALKAKERFEKDVLKMLKELGKNLFNHRYAEEIYSALVTREYEKETSPEKRGEEDFKNWVLQNEKFLVKTTKEVNAQFVKEQLLTIYKVRLENLVNHPKIFDDQVVNVRLSFIRWFYRRTIGMIDTNPRFKQFREDRILEGLSPEEKMIALEWEALDKEFSSETVVFPVSNQWWIRDLELLIERCSEGVHTIGDFLRGSLLYYVLLNPPFSRVPKGVANYFYEKVTSEAFRIKNFPVPVEDILPNVFYSDKYDEKDLEKVKKLIGDHVEDQIRWILFDLPYFKFSRVSLLNITHQSIIRKLSSYTNSVQEQCALDTNTGVQPLRNHMHKGWYRGKNLDSSNLKYMDSGDVVLCIHKGKFYCHSEKALVNQFLQGDFFNYQTGKQFPRDYVEAILAPYENLEIDDSLPEIGVIGTYNLQEIVEAFGPGKYTIDYNTPGLKKLIIKINDEEGLRYSNLRLPPVPKVILMKGLEKSLEEFVKTTFKERMLGDLKFVSQKKTDPIKVPVPIEKPGTKAPIPEQKEVEKAPVSQKKTDPIKAPVPEQKEVVKAPVTQQQKILRDAQKGSEPKQQEQMSWKRAQERAKDIDRVLPREWRGAGKRYLDIGTGNGQIPQAVIERLDLDEILTVTTDIYEKDMPYKTNENLWLESGIRGDRKKRGQELDYVKTEGISFESHPAVRFDLVTAMMVLHHIPQLDKFLEGLVSKMAPGGYLVVREHDIDSEDPRQKNLNDYVDDYHKKWPDFTPSSFMKLFSKKTLVEKLKALGLRYQSGTESSTKDPQRRYIACFYKPFDQRESVYLTTIGGYTTHLTRSFIEQEYTKFSDIRIPFEEAEKRRYKGGDSDSYSTEVKFIIKFLDDTFLVDNQENGNKIYTALAPRERK